MKIVGATGPEEIRRLRSLAVLLGVSEADARELWSERAAIREYLGGVPRKDAEQGAWKDMEGMRRR
jgi:hypothetical protein